LSLATEFGSGPNRVAKESLLFTQFGA